MRPSEIRTGSVDVGAVHELAGVAELYGHVPGGGEGAAPEGGFGGGHRHLVVARPGDPLHKHQQPGVDGLQSEATSWGAGCGN